MEILGRCVVRTRRANHIEPLESQLGLKLAQHIDLTGDTDQSQSAKTSACAYWNKASKRMHRIRVRTCSISAVSMMRPGYGFRRSFASGDTATIVPFSSNSAPQPVVILIHCAPFTGSAIRTRCIHWTGPKNRSPLAPCVYHSRKMRLEELASRAACRWIGHVRHTKICAPIARHEVT